MASVDLQLINMIFLGIVEYIVGYALRKVKHKFPNNQNDNATLCNEKATFEFGQSVQRFQDHLNYETLRKSFKPSLCEISVESISKKHITAYGQV